MSVGVGESRDVPGDEINRIMLKEKRREKHNAVTQLTVPDKK